MLRPGRVALAVVAAASVLALAPSPAAAFNPVGTACKVAGWVSGIAGKACGALQNGGRVVNAGKKLLSGRPGAAAKALVSGGVSKVGVAASLTALGAWVLVGAKATLTESARLIDSTTTPKLTTTWFSSTYWRMAEVAAVLTLPFLFAAAVQAMVRSDFALLARAAFGYLPLALVAVSIAAPLTMLLLAASDQMSAVVASAAGGNGARALSRAALFIAPLTAIDHSPFLAFLLGLFIAAGAFVLWLELLVREAAVYVVVLMLPLAFAALVWPARRIWAIRAVELLVALVLAKFAIVAVLTLAAAGLGHNWLTGPSSAIAGAALVALATCAPWALLRLLPLTEAASAAAGSLRQDAFGARPRAVSADRVADATTTAVEDARADHAETIDSEDRGRARETAHAQTERLDEDSARVASTASTNGQAPAAESGAGDAETGTPPAPPPQPGVPEIFHADNDAWAPVVLGLGASSQRIHLQGDPPPLDADKSPPDLNTDPQLPPDQDAL